MALFQPTNVTPSNFNGTGTVDITDGMDVTWQVNGNSPMVAYQIRIMQNDTDSTEVYDSGKLTLLPPFYGTDSRGNPKVFTKNIAAAALSTAGITNGYENGYKLQITEWWGNTDEQSITQSSASYFITRDKPTVTMGIISTQFTFIRNTFTATYAQAQGDAIEWSRWEIENVDEAYGKIYDSGKIYGAAELETTYEGFFPTTQYRIKCTVQTENGVEADTGWVVFNTWYNSGYDTANMLACPLCDRDAVRVGVPKNMYVLGRDNGGGYAFSVDSTNRKIRLSDETAITWSGGIGETLNIGGGVTYVVYGITGTPESLPEHPMARFYGNGLEMGVWNSTGGIYVTINGQAVFTANTGASSGIEYAIAVTNSEIRIGYIKNGTTTIENTLLTPWQDKIIEAITIYGPNDFSYVWAFEGDEPYNADYIINGNQYYPAYVNRTQFLYTAISADLYTGPNSNTRTTVFSLYRKNPYDVVPIHIADMPIGFTSVLDYSAGSQQNYTYRLFPLFSNGYSDYNIDPFYTSLNVRPLWWNYTVLTAYPDSKGIYHVIDEYRFALDVSSGAVGNNNSPAMMQNFTRYPTVQKTSANYRSGTLSAFIGKVSDDKYVDTIDLMEDLYALSTSNLTKFLKTRKGDFMMIEVSAPIAMQIGDKFAVQPAKISLPWAEVGSTEGISAVGNCMMADAPFFYVDLVTGELIMLYNPEYVESDAFSLTTGDLYLNDPGIYDEYDYSLNSDKEVRLEVG